MRNWLEQFNFNPLPLLLSLDNKALLYFVHRDLTDEAVESVTILWDLPQVKKEISRQQSDGSWKYPANKEQAKENYNLLETSRVMGHLVEKFGLDNRHPAIQRASDYLFSCQTEAGDFRGIYGTQYSPNYSASITELLIKVGYENDSRIEKSFEWLLSIRQDDGGWAIPIRTHAVRWEETLEYPIPLQPLRLKPFSHLVTGMVLRAFAAHPTYRHSEPAKQAGFLLSSRLFEPDKYVDRRHKNYWEETSFPFSFTDIVSALDSLSLMGFTKDNDQISKALEWLRGRQLENGLFEMKLLKAKDKDTIYWSCLAICRVFKQFYK